MNLLLALTFTEAQCERLHAACAPLREAGYPIEWVEPQDLQLILKVLGTVHPDRVSSVESTAIRVVEESRPFTLSLTGIGAFPTLRLPEVLWVGADPSPALRCLRVDLEWGLTAHGFASETRAFHPHITLGRVLRKEGAGAFRRLDEWAASDEFRMEIPIDSVALLRAKATKTGGHAYSVLRTIPLPPSGARG
jgi:RNA 2',3'-cyclic 3'-phosphodiesterase